MIPAIAGAGALLMLLTVVIVFVQARKPKPAKAQGDKKREIHQKLIKFLLQSLSCHFIFELSFFHFKI